MKIHGNIHRETKFAEPSREAQELPFYPLLPRDPIELLKFRIYVRERCIEDMEFRQLITQMCAADCAFFIQVFGYFHETRDTGGQIGKFPVRLYQDQVDLIAWFMAAIGKTDVVVEKTRGIGLSYLIICIFLWIWLFRGESLDLALVSKSEHSLDIPKRPSSLMGKLDLLFENLPLWMQIDDKGKPICNRTLKDHKFVNMVNQNAILGHVPTNDKLRSGRFYAVGIDEGAFLDNNDQRFLAATQETTFSRIWISTHNGTATLFYRLTRDTTSDLFRISTWWWENEFCRRGLYQVEKGRIVNLDDNVLPDYDYSYEHSGKLRSWWLDKAFRRAGANPQLIFEELYGIAALQHRKLFREEVLEMARASCSPPSYRGFVDEEGLFTEDLDGHWFLWVPPESLNGTYVIGCDPAIGTPGGAYAGLCAFDIETGATVLTAQLPNCPGIEFAGLAVGAGKLLSGARGAGYAKICFESTGINVTFTNEIVRLRYPSVFRGKNDKLGLPNKDKGESWLLELGRAIRDAEAFIFDERLADEFDHFEYNVQKFELQYTDTDGHGDLAIAAGLGWQAAKDRRRRLVRQGESQYNGSVAVGPEAEPSVIARKQGADVWSNQFRRNISGY